MSSCVQNASRGLVVPARHSAAGADRAGVPHERRRRQGREGHREAPGARGEELPRVAGAAARLRVHGHGHRRAAARAAGLGIVAGLFGPDLDAAIVPETPTATARAARATCSIHGRPLLHHLEGGPEAKKNVLKGTGAADRHRAPSPRPPISSGAGRRHPGRRAAARSRRRRTKLHDKAALRCTETLTPLGADLPRRLRHVRHARRPRRAAPRASRAAQFFQSLAPPTRCRSTAT